MALKLAGPQLDGVALTEDLNGALGRTCFKDINLGERHSGVTRDNGTVTLCTLVVTIHLSPFTCCFRSFFRRSFTGSFRSENAKFTY